VKDTASPALASLPSLPLSWQHVSGQDAWVGHWQRLSLARVDWLAWADVPPSLALADLLRQTRDSHPRLLVRGVPANLLPVFEDEGFSAVAQGQVADLHLADAQQHWQRPSLRALARRGLRWGQVHEFPLRPHTLATAQHLLDSLAQRSPWFARQRATWLGFGMLPPTALRHLFRREVQPEMRLFMFDDEEVEVDGSIQYVNEKLPLAAVLLSPSLAVSGGLRWHTELLVRQVGQPVGVMEALLSQVADTLRAEGASVLSLGEVPFRLPPGTPQTVQSLAVCRAGLAFGGLGYRADSLGRFKAKFRPYTQAVYLCARPRLPYRALLEMARRSGYLALQLRHLIQ
jgi:hypothetical protein